MTMKERRLKRKLYRYTYIFQEIGPCLSVDEILALYGLPKQKRPSQMTEPSL